MFDFFTPVFSTVMLGNPADPVNVAFQKALTPWLTVEIILGAYIILLVSILLVGIFVVLTVAALRPVFKLGGLILLGIGSLFVMIWEGVKFIIKFFFTSLKSNKPVQVYDNDKDYSRLEYYTEPKVEPTFDPKNIMKININDEPRNIIHPSVTTKNLVINGYRIPLQ